MVAKNKIIISSIYNFIEKRPSINLFAFIVARESKWKKKMYEFIPDNSLIVFLRKIFF